MTEDFVPEWMTRLCRCGHVDTMHAEGPCEGRVANQYGPAAKCRCQAYRHRWVTSTAEVARSPRAKAAV